MLKMEELLAEMQKMRGEVTEKLQRIENAVASAESVRREWATFEKKQDKKVSALETKVQELSLMLKKFEFESKKNNLVLYEFNPGARGRSLKDDLLQCFGRVVPSFHIRWSDIKEAFRMKTRSGEVSPVLIRFTTKDIRDSLLRSNRYLREYGLKAAPDYAKVVRISEKKVETDSRASKK